MRISTQLVLGYALAVVATVAVAVIAWNQISAMERDLADIADEWEELDSLGAALASFRLARESGDRTHLDRGAALLESMIAESAEKEDPHGVEHERRERAIWSDLLALVRGAQEASPGDFRRFEEQAAGLALAFWQEDRDRVPRRLDKLEVREARLRRVNLAAAAGLVLLPLLFLLYLHVRIARPLARIQRRVEAIGGVAPAARGGSRMDRLADAIAAMAESVEARQQSLTQQLRHADRLGGLGRIAAAVAHELNTPLGSIGLCAEGIRTALAESPPPAGQIERYAETIGQQLEACTATTRNLLSYARFRPSEPVNARADALATEAVELVQSHVRKSGVRVEVEGAAGEEEVRGDPAQLRQAVVNLLLNAIDSSPRGGRVRVETRAAGPDVEIRVRDEGPGVPRELREEIFNPFFTTKRPGEGTGLGLSIAREIVESHGGTLALEDADRGASFLIRLPSAKMVRS